MLALLPSVKTLINLFNKLTMDLFKSLLQPTIVHFGKNEKYQISDEYLLNYNVVQIDWFKNNSIVLEDCAAVIKSS